MKAKVSASGDEGRPPVSIPAGSFDFDALHRATDSATGPADLAAKLAAAGAHPVGEPGVSPGYKLVEVTHPELGITERIQVPVTPDPSPAAPAPDPATRIE